VTRSWSVRRRGVKGWTQRIPGTALLVAGAAVLISVVSGGPNQVVVVSLVGGCVGVFELATQSTKLKYTTQVKKSN
jgi:hypothetical protein